MWRAFCVVAFLAVAQARAQGALRKRLSQNNYMVEENVK
jgi:hypothetical protein